MHSKHVIHVFPRKAKMLISEWARAIRVAHSVKKTFILAMPGRRIEIKTDPKRPKLDFLLYHRKKGGIDTPKDATPRYLLIGQLRRDYAILPSDRTMLDVPGGNLLYTAVGLAIGPRGLAVRQHGGEQQCAEQHSRTLQGLQCTASWRLPFRSQRAAGGILGIELR
jgi:hypothetical protein